MSAEIRSDARVTARIVADCKREAVSRRTIHAKESKVSKEWSKERRMRWNSKESKVEDGRDPQGVSPPESGFRTRLMPWRRTGTLKFMMRPTLRPDRRR